MSETPVNKAYNTLDERQIGNEFSLVDWIGALGTTMKIALCLSPHTISVSNALGTSLRGETPTLRFQVQPKLEAHRTVKEKRAALCSSINTALDQSSSSGVCVIGWDFEDIVPWKIGSTKCIVLYLGHSDVPKPDVSHQRDAYCI